VSDAAADRGPGLRPAILSGAAPTVGDMMRNWRRRRRMSQLSLALDADVSARHLSFVESGRARASREMLMRLADQLAMPLRERNRLLLAGGYAPMHGERALDAPDMAAARAAVETVLKGHEPFPALAIDRRWSLVAANAGAAALMAGAAPRLLAPPVNVLRLSLDPEGLAPKILNLAEWRHHLLGRLRAEAMASGDEALMQLQAELAALPAPVSKTPPGEVAKIAVPLILRAPSGEPLSLISTTTVFGTASDVTLSELTLECFFPADEPTRAWFLASMHGPRGPA